MTLANGISNNPSRRVFTRQRRHLSTQQRRLAAKLASRYLPKLVSRLPKNAKVALYLDCFGELPTQPILDWCKRLGYVAYLPVVATLGRQSKIMQFARIYHHTLVGLPTVPHHLGTRQPKSRQLIFAKDLDIIFCPLVAVDLQGNRMGMGGGYYDTTLAKVKELSLPNPIIVGWCYDFQVVEQLYRQPWDVSLDMAITPMQLLSF